MTLCFAGSSFRCVSFAATVLALEHVVHSSRMISSNMSSNRHFPFSGLDCFQLTTWEGAIQKGLVLHCRCMPSLLRRSFRASLQAVLQALVTPPLEVQAQAEAEVSASHLQSSQSRDTAQGHPISCGSSAQIHLPAVSKESHCRGSGRVGIRFQEICWSRARLLCR